MLLWALLILSLAELGVCLYYGRLAYKDALTGLKNRRSFERQISRLEKRKKPFCHAALDLNNLKNVNDRYGHQAGDRYLVWGANVLKSYIKSKDYLQVYRIGGDEFALIYAGRDTKKGMQIMVSLEKQLEFQVWDGDKYSGIAMGHDCISDYLSDNCLELLKRSDRKMYVQKRKMKERA